jgi:hypothetical protein
MDRKLQQQEIQRLILLGDRARSTMEIGVISLKKQLDVPARIRGSLKTQPIGWLLGSMAAGLVISRLLAPKAAPDPKKKRGLPITLLGLTLTAVRPFAKVWLADQVKNYLAGQPFKPTAIRPQAGTSTQSF